MLVALPAAFARPASMTYAEVRSVVLNVERRDANRRPMRQSKSRRPREGKPLGEGKQLLLPLS